MENYIYTPTQSSTHEIQSCLFLPFSHRILSSMMLPASASSTIEAEAQCHPLGLLLLGAATVRVDGSAWASEVTELAEQLDDAWRGSGRCWRGGRPLG